LLATLGHKMSVAANYFLFFRLLVERLLNTCLVPFQLPAEERMKKLYHLLGTIDENATKAFIELQKHQLA